MVTRESLSYACGYAGNPCGYVSYAVTRWFVTLTRGGSIPPFNKIRLSRERYQTWRNRVTHVTTGLSGVTARVTISFTRNQKEMSVQKEEKAEWLKKNLPTVAGVVDEFAAAFGRENLRVTYASENGHTLGQAFVAVDGVKLSETSISGSLVAR